MIELRFYSGKAYSVRQIWEDEQCVRSFGSDADGTKIEAIELKKLGIFLVGEKLNFDNEGPPRYVNVALEFILAQMTPAKFCELIEQIAKDRYSAGHADGKAEIQQGLQNLIGIEFS